MIQTNTFDYLRKLRKNNNKDWFDKHRNLYEAARNEFIAFVQSLIEGISKYDPAVAHNEAKKCIFRINRDIRFSSDKTPYKTSFTASISPGGKGSFSAGYYIHIEPGDSYIAGGMWQPESPKLHAIRQEIDYNANEFRKIIGQKDFKKYFGGLSDEDKLKTVPKGYSKEHPEIELLKNRSFIVVHNISEKELQSPKAESSVVAVMHAITPLNKFLRRACD